MGRTTIEVEKTVRNRLRTYKQSHGMTYDGALDRLLTTAGEPLRDEETATTLHDGTETIYWSDVDPYDAPEMCTFHDGFLQSATQPTVFGGSGNRELPVKDFRNALETVAPFLSNGAHSGSFAIHCSGRTWYGYGLGSFYDTLIHREAEKQEANTLSQQPETAVYVGRGDWGYVCIGLELTATQRLSNVTLQFVTDGVPLTQYPYATLVQQMGLDLTTARKLAVERMSIEDMPIQSGMDVVETIPGDAQRSNEARLKGAQIRNPFYDDPERLHACTETTDAFETVTAYEYIPCRLVWPQSVDDPREYASVAVTLHRLSTLTTGFDVINVECRIQMT